MQSLEAPLAAAAIPAGRIRSRVKLEAWARRRSEKPIEIIPGQLFDEPGGLDSVSPLAPRWFGEHLRKNACIAA